MTGRGGSGGRRFTTTVLAALALLVLASAPASAHTEVLRSDPPNGGMVPVGRTTLTLWFGEQLNPAASSFVLHTGEGLEVAAQVAVQDDGQVVELTTDPLELGTYVLDWHAMSLEDGHSSTGAVVFGAGMRPTTLAAQGTRLPPPELVLLRWLDLCAVLLALGCLTVGSRLSEARVGRLARVAVLAAVYAGAVTPFLRTRQSGAPVAAWVDQTWLTLTDTRWGVLWLLRELALVAAAVGIFRWAGPGTDRRPAGRVALAALVTAVALESWGGHASTLHGSSGLAAVMATGHVLAAGVWVGGLAVLAIVLLPTRHDPTRTGPDWRAAWAAWSPLAAVSTVVLVATGLYQTGRHVPGLAELGTTTYGLGVTAKVALVTVALALAGLNTLIVHPRLAARVPAAAGIVGNAGGTTRLGRTVRAELVVLGVAVFLGALLTAVPTSREVAQATRPTSPHAENVDGLFVTFEAVPSGTARTRLIVRVRPTTLPQPAPVAGVDVLLSGPGGLADSVALDEVEPGRFEGDTGALGPGDWRGEVRVHRPGLPDAAASADWTVEPATRGDSGGLRTATTWLAALLLGGLLLVVWRVQRARPTAAADPEPARSTVEGSTR
jgi:copper transport protein